MAATVEEKILAARAEYVRHNARYPDCVVIDSGLEDQLDPRVFDKNLITIAGMHVIFADNIPHQVVRCGRMR